MIRSKYLVCFVCISLVLSVSGILLNRGFLSQTDDPNTQKIIYSAGPSVRVVNKTSPACTTGDFYYSTIQGAVDAAISGDTIIVCLGTYSEWVDVFKSLNITSYAGPDVTILDGSGEGTWGGFEVEANYVNITGFTITGYTGLSGSPPSKPNAGIHLVRSEYADISNNDISSNQAGIFLWSSTYSTIENNKLRSNNCAENNCSGIWLHDSSNYNIIRYNTFIGNDYGIYLDDEVTPCIDNTISYNNFIANDHGVRIKGSHNNTVITCNNFRGNQYHIYLCPGDSPSVGNITIQYNNFFDRGQYIFYNNQSADVVATHNWWGTTNETLIEELIYDKNDDPSLGRVIYKPYLTSPLSPTINQISISPILEITANITHPANQNITEVMDYVKLYFKIEEDWYSMSLDYNPETALHSALIPAYNQLANKTIQYYVTAKDKLGNTVTSDIQTHHVPEWVIADLNRNGEIDQEDIEIFQKYYNVDIAITDTTLSNPSPKINETIQINVTLTNLGDITQTFNLTLNYTRRIDPTIETQIVTLEPEQTITITFTWTPNQTGRYTLTAYTSTIPLDKNPENNKKQTSLYVRPNNPQNSSSNHTPRIWKITEQTY